MQASAKRIDFREKAQVQKARVDRINPDYNNSFKAYYHTRPDTGPKETCETKIESKKSHSSRSSQFNYKGIWDFLKSEEALILIIIFILLIEGNTDYILIAALVYLLLADVQIPFLNSILNN